MRHWLLWLLAMLALSCGRDSLVMHFPAGGRDGRITCGGTTPEETLSFSLVSSCDTDAPLTLIVENDVGLEIHREERKIPLIAGREEPLSASLSLPKQSMRLCVKAQASCHPKSSNRVLFVEEKCVAE